MSKHSSRLRSLGFVLALCGGLLVAPVAFAGDVKFGAAPLEIDDSGKITDAGKKAAIKQLPSRPGEEVWPLHVWAQIDKGAPGPLYVEFFDKLPGSGKRYKAWAYEHTPYEGEKYVTLELELEGDVGFNKGHTYTIEVSQLDNKGKNLVLASGQLELVYTQGKPEDEEEEGEDEGEKDEDGEDEGQTEEQDELDSFAGGDEGKGEAPPPVTSPGKKKGCSVDSDSGAAPGVLVLLLLGAGLAGRSRRKRP
jgi:MYXO-CTERM domain-containing protein